MIILLFALLLCSILIRSDDDNDDDASNTVLIHFFFLFLFISDIFSNKILFVPNLKIWHGLGQECDFIQSTQQSLGVFYLLFLLWYLLTALVINIKTQIL